MYLLISDGYALELVEDGINCLTSGRGGLVYVKNAIVEGPRNIKCVMSTQLKIYR